MAILSGGNSLLDVGLILKKARVEEKMKVADLGCGSSGHFIFPASELVGNDGTVYAVDIMKTTLEAIKKRKHQENAANIITVWSNLEIFNAAQIESGSIDVAFLINTLYQSHRHEEIIHEASRMIKKNGRLLVAEWKKVTAPFGPPIEERVDKELVINQAKKYSLELDEEFFTGHYHYGLLFNKI